MEFDNLKSLSNQAMVGATKGWVEPGEALGAMTGIKEVAGYLDRMAGAHRGLLRFQVTQGTSPRVNTMVERGLVLDARFDRLARGINQVIEGNLLLLEPEDRAVSALTALKTRLFPRGMGIIHTTYLEEAGEADMVKERLREEDRELLGQVPVMGKNLSVAVDEWVETGTELGALERERARAADAVQSAGGVSRANVLSARNLWIRVVRAILAGLDLAENLDEEIRAVILNPLRIAVEKVAQKAKPKEPEQEDEVPEEPAPAE